MQNQVVCTLMHCCPKLWENTDVTYNVHASFACQNTFSSPVQVTNRMFVQTEVWRQTKNMMLLLNNPNQTYSRYICSESEIYRHLQGLWIINKYESHWCLNDFFFSQRSRWFAQGSSPKWRYLLIYLTDGCTLWSPPRNPWTAITSSLMTEVWHIQPYYP